MKIALLPVLVCFGIIVISRAIAQDNVDPDMQEQINAAKKQAAKMGVKMPDIEKMMQESDAEDSAGKKDAATRGCAKNGASGGVAIVDSGA